VDRRVLLATVAATQLGLSVAGMALALRRGYPFDVPFMRGHPDDLARDSILMGTALSAPVVMLSMQAIAIAMIVRRESRIAARTLEIIGAINVPGYLSERHVRRRLTPSGWDALETPLILASLPLAAAMPLLARSATPKHDRTKRTAMHRSAAGRDET
jgi:hypothetical protein